MNILDTAIQAEGGVSNLAKALGIRQSAVSNWRSRGIPRGWQAALEGRYGDDKKKRKPRAAVPQPVGA
ncbi:YdaS family helix-turn-helix protein [Curvibacter sp. HBC61]|uniref:YdaS family helix-turn-helix protein n=1 Tax=Curvibacter cyanobacteriorum TaxID=3026422 RepID=A0ABT5MV08_9BURK|nr:YdaS family helix-turn-helix protein [Curvibacter sp. HBC61]MDD0837882.1 YdaS family helix-turn-helix protein [Curvibacter sp. HBC61]